MKKIIQGKIGTILLATVAGLAVAAVLWHTLGVGNWYRVREAIQDIAKGANVAKARTTLEMLNERAYVLEKLTEAVEGDEFDVGGKANLLTTLNMFGQPRVLKRAVDSKSVTTQRAACTLLYGDPEMKTRCAEIALAWLKDEGAANRSAAAGICGQIDIKEAQPILLEIVQRDPKTVEERDLFQRALIGLKDPKPKELVDRLLKLASDDKEDRDIRAVALESLQRMKEGPRDEILTLSTRILTDPNGDPILRAKAALGLQAFPEDRAWQALETVLLSDHETDFVLQRSCLRSLAQMDPEDKDLARRYIERLKKLLLDRRVYQNPYFAIRVDVATALCALNLREGITLDIMCDYLVDEDPKDKEHIVRQEGWLTLWTLTGTRFQDIPQPELFQSPPPPFPDPLAARQYLLSRFRPGIKPAQNAVVKTIASDLPLMQKTRQMYQSKKAEILEHWRSEAAAKQAKAEQRGQAQGVGPAPQGPQAPQDNGAQKPGDKGTKEGSGDEPAGPKKGD